MCSVVPRRRLSMEVATTRPGPTLCSLDKFYTLIHLSLFELWINSSHFGDESFLLTRFDTELTLVSIQLSHQFCALPKQICISFSKNSSHVLPTVFSQVIICDISCIFWAGAALYLLSGCYLVPFTLNLCSLHPLSRLTMPFGIGYSRSRLTMSFDIGYFISSYTKESFVCAKMFEVFGVSYVRFVNETKLFVFSEFVVNHFAL